MSIETRKKLNFKELLQKENSRYVTDTDITTGFDIDSHRENVDIVSLYEFIGDKKFIISKPGTDLKDKYSFRLEIYILSGVNCFIVGSEHRLALVGQLSTGK